ncbi:hypothetical protein MYX07_01100 [Patescibacteria group bacterium AH-259-L07]|nr:hypothetical protein [Patescibacteria group bacterium AH-259-L07]
MLGDGPLTISTKQEIITMTETKKGPAAQFIEEQYRQLLTSPDDVKVTETPSERTLIITVHVNDKKDGGLARGKEFRTWNAIKDLAFVHHRSAGDKRRLMLEGMESNKTESDKS